jgi:hypothetical protein
MSNHSHSKTTVIVIGDDGLLKQQQITSLEAGGNSVISFDASAAKQDILGCRSRIEGELRVVFTPYQHNEFTLLEQGADTLLSHISERTKAFLAQAQAALQLLMDQGGGQFWVCDFDDSFSYHMDTPSCPVAAQARAGAVRSMAKEYSRMKITVNSMLVQPVVDEQSKAMFRKASAGLKSYAMRYKPNTPDEVANLLCRFLSEPRLQFSGNIIGTGTGIVQGHLTA